MRALVVAMAAALFLAGCTEGVVAEDASDDGFGLPIDTAAGTGIIRGVVVDDAIVPVADATVQLLVGDDASDATTTDEEGRFAFADLAPGTYLVEVSSLFHAPTQASVEVIADDPAPPLVKIQVSRLFSQEPFLDQQHMQGYINCGYHIGLAAPCIIDYTQLVYPGGALPILYGISGDVRRFVIPINDQWQNTVVEVVWEPSAAALSKALGLTASFFNRTSSHSYGGASGESPILFRMDMDPERSHPDWVGPEGQHDFLVFVNPNNSGSTVPLVAVTLEQEFELFMHTSYNGLLPEEWSFVAGDGPPF